MDTTELMQISQAWIEYHHAGDQADEHHRDFWAYEKLSELTREAPETAWDLMVAILRQDQSDTIVANLAAGPMEDLLGMHGERFIQRIESMAKVDHLFYKLVTAIWQNEIPDGIWLRLKSIPAPN